MKVKFSENEHILNNYPPIIGINDRSYPSQDNNYVNVTVVLVQGNIGDYAAYIGQGKADWVAKYGNKLSFEEACIHFPGGQLKRELYRD